MNLSVDLLQCKVFFVLASFEVTVNNKLIYSKLERGGFPAFGQVLYPLPMIGVEFFGESDLKGLAHFFFHFHVFRKFWPNHRLASHLRNLGLY